MRRFFLEQKEIKGLKSYISGTDARHIKTVLRLKPGDRIGLFDGAGNEYSAGITGFSHDRVEVSILDSFPSVAEPSVQIIVFQALLKDRKMDILVRQLTELGISGLIPFVAERSVSRPDAKRLIMRRERWNKISKEALKQCKRGRIMKIGEPVFFEDALKIGKDADLKVIFWEKESKSVDFAISHFGSKFEKIFLMLGPEGGFTVNEIEKAASYEFVSASLGPRVLRAETATIAASVMIQYIFGDLR